ncbi:hypothetical protein TNCV_3183211 [Trichonephila clavipes]|uniref:Uncharacterized protein n=1 Tax=Trichonephila clavipes TaxID=2585209 RepID=A0A8X6VKU7_TRICX|nr:hypothetical protein TNCV_3183211 [Trichonephila clavipes]
MKSINGMKVVQRYASSMRPGIILLETGLQMKCHERPVEQAPDLASHLCILAFQSLHFIDKFLAATIAASTNVQ